MGGGLGRRPGPTRSPRRPRLDHRRSARRPLAPRRRAPGAGRAASGGPHRDERGDLGRPRGGARRCAAARPGRRPRQRGIPGPRDRPCGRGLRAPGRGGRRPRAWRRDRGGRARTGAGRRPRRRAPRRARTGPRREHTVGRGAALLHVRHHRRAEGRHAHPRQRVGELRGHSHRVALERRRPPRARAPALPRARPRRRTPRHAALRGLDRPRAPLHSRCGARRGARARCDPVLRGPHDVRAPRGIAARWPSWLDCASASPVPLRSPPRCTTSSPTPQECACSSATG